MEVMWVRCLLVGCLLGCGRVDFDERSPGTAGSPDAPDASDAPGSQGAWQLVSAKGVAGNGAGTVTAPLGSPSTAGQLIVVSANTDVNVVLSSLTDDAGNTYVPVPASRADSSSTNDTVVFWYAANVTAGATAVTGTASSIWTFAVWQFDVPGPVSVDAAAGLSDQAANKNPLSPPLTLTHAGDIVLGAMIVKGTVTQIDTAYMLDSTANANGFGHLVDAAAPAGMYQAVWTQQNGTAYCSNAIALTVAP
jgi:hypothetical protein